MQGDDHNPGVIPQAIQALFVGGGESLSVAVSMMEVYNDEVRDLMAQCDDSEAETIHKVTVRHGHNGAVFCGLSSVKAEDPEAVLKAMEAGMGTC